MAINNLDAEKAVLYYPMGPKLREWFGIAESDYKGHYNPKPTEPERQNLLNYLFQYMQNHPLTTEQEVISILDELLSMKMPAGVLKVADQHSLLLSRTDFRGLLAEGVAAMMTSEFERAESCFIHAQEILPLEPAPYVNMIQILLEEDRLVECKMWVESGIKANPNYFGIWECSYRYFSQINPKMALFELEKLAKENNSWAFWCFEAELTTPPDEASTRLKDKLEEFYQKGERSSEFLLEYTGILGKLGKYEPIPGIIWEAEKVHTQNLPWQLWVHCLQALAVIDEKVFEETLAHVKNKLPKEEFDALKQFF